MEWKPIATAPKDGTHLLAWSKGWGYFACRWYTPEQLAEYEDELQPFRPPNDPADYDGGWFTLGDVDEQTPTHWMPLPPPPAPEAGDVSPDVGASGRGGE